MTLLIFALVIALVVRQPNLRIPFTAARVTIDYGVAPILGVLVLLAYGTVEWQTVTRGIVGTATIRPYAILILFNALAYVCISLDRTGFFAYIALRTTKAAGTSGRKLFFYFFALSSVLTAFTSNDIVILTLTPLICYFTHYTKTDPVPYLIGQFFAANIWSVALYVGNPTNIIVAEAYGLGFLEYSLWMVLPTIAAGLTCLLGLWLMFHKRIPVEIAAPEMDPAGVLRDRAGAAFGVTCLLGCLVLLSISSWLGFDIWKICLVTAVLMFLRDLRYDLHSTSLRAALAPEAGRYPTVTGVVMRMPWRIVPFVIGMFTLVAALSSEGWTDLFAGGMTTVSPSLFPAVLSMTFISSIAANLINNQPMTILFTEITQSPSFVVASDTIRRGSMYGLIMGSNFGANFTLVGALAGIMWKNILADKGVAISYREFARYGFVVMPFVVLSACLVLYAELLAWG